MTELLPSYYLAHYTPEGRRFAYPRPTLEGYGNQWSTPAVSWDTPDDPGISVAEVGSWLVADTPLRVVTATWSPARRASGWRKRRDGPADLFVRPAWMAAPDPPTDDNVEHWKTHESEDCLRCQVFLAVNERDYVQPPPEVRTVDFTEWVPLPGEPDPAPDRSWVLHDGSAVAVYGAHTAHLWPGYLPGFRDRVYELLQADPRVEYVFDSKNHRDQPHGSLQTTVRIKWEAPKSELRSRTGVGGRKLRGKVTVPQPVAHSARTTRVVPSGLAGASKADAITAWDTEIARYIGLLVPVDVVACLRCDGHGHLLARDVEEEQ